MAGFHPGVTSNSAREFTVRGRGAVNFETSFSTTPLLPVRGSIQIRLGARCARLPAACWRLLTAAAKKNVHVEQPTGMAVAGSPAEGYSLEAKGAQVSNCLT